MSHLCLWPVSDTFVPLTNTNKFKHLRSNPGNRVHGTNMGPTWILSAPHEPHVGPMNLAIREPIKYDEKVNQNTTCHSIRIGIAFLFYRVYILTVNWTYSIHSQLLMFALSWKIWLKSSFISPSVNDKLQTGSIIIGFLFNLLTTRRSDFDYQWLRYQWLKCSQMHVIGLYWWWVAWRQQVMTSANADPHLNRDIASLCRS